MFQEKVVINGGTFVQNVNAPSQDQSIVLQESQVARTQASISFEKLAGNAFPRAFHLAGSDPSHAVCFANTRVKILESLQNWALRKTEKDSFITWLHGAAGGGKTSIARTFANWCDEQQGILLGEFFFSRADGADNQFSSLAPTLAYRMAVHTLKDAKGAISNVISHDPHIFQAPLAHQLKKLVLEPLDLLIPNGITPYVVILDGLEETLSDDDQELILRVISGPVYQHTSTLRILICSRTEPTIATAFNDDEFGLKDISNIISLNDDADSEDDIRLFLSSRFAKIKKQLPFVPAGEWPSPEAMNYLVAKSSRQFIFAATVDKYVGSPKHRHHAVARFKHVLDLASLPHLQDPKRHPFADLDALYSVILRTRTDVRLSVKAMAICLQYTKYFGVTTPIRLAKVLQIDLAETWSILYELASLLDASKDYIRPFHASFGDFLFDQSRSVDLHCAKREISSDIACAALREKKRIVPSYYVFYRLMEEAAPCTDLRDLLHQVKPSVIFGRYERHKIPRGAYYLIPLLKQVKNHVSDKVFRSFITYFDLNFQTLLPNGTWRKDTFPFRNLKHMSSAKVTQKTQRMTDTSATEESDSSVSSSKAVRKFTSNPVLRETPDGDDIFVRADTTNGKEPGTLPTLIYNATDVVPLIGLSSWHGVKAQVNITLQGSQTIQGLCEEAEFVFSYLPNTRSAILKQELQTKGSLFCIKEICSADMEEDVRLAFANLLAESLVYAKMSHELRASIDTLRTELANICQKIPPDTLNIITNWQLHDPYRHSPGLGDASSKQPRISLPKFDDCAPFYWNTEGSSSRDSQRLNSELNPSISYPYMEPKMPTSKSNTTSKHPGSRSIFSKFSFRKGT